MTAANRLLISIAGFWLCWCQTTALAEPWHQLPVTPLNSSAMLLDLRRLDRGEQLVDRAALTGGGRIQVVINLHVRLSDELEVFQYGLLRDRTKSWTDLRNFTPMDEDLSRHFERQLQRVFARANEQDLDVAVLPHLDAAGPVQVWRNEFRFDPRQRIDGHSYQSAMIEPIVEALAATNDDKRRVWLALSGEMGRSLFEHPASYQHVVRQVRTALPADRTQVGVSLNHNELAGGHQQSADQRVAMQDFLEACDFIGVSCYRPFTPPARPANFAETARVFRAEFRDYGLRYPVAAALHFSEVGIGGVSESGAWGDPLAAANAPWQGVARGQKSPWASWPMQRLRRDYYASLLAYLRDDAEPYRPEAAFMWSEGSWEPMGVDQRQFSDRQIIREVLRHNLNAAQVAKTKESESN
ncbi:MAG: hypothetical protein AAGF31_05570 [Planctomycetota bacterium]